MNPLKQFFTRHFITAPVSFLTWFALLGGTTMSFVPATAIMIGMYIGGTYSIKQIQLSSNLKKLGMSRSELQHIQNQLTEAQVKLRKLNGLYGKVRSVSAFKQLYEMNTISRKIMSIVRTNPRKFYHAEQFFYAHLDSAVELTSKYAMLVNQPIKDTEMRIALQNTRDTLDNVTTQLEQDLRGALASDIEQLQMEIDFVDMSMNKRKPLLEMKGDSENDAK